MSLNKILALFIFSSAFSSVFSSTMAVANESLKNLLEEMENVKPVCKRLSAGCAICSDGVKRPPLGTGWGDDVAVDTDRSKAVLVSDYDCAMNEDAKKSKDGCRELSDFCSLCPDGRYFYKKSKIRIRADLYECATRPRTYTKR